MSKNLDEISKDLKDALALAEMFAERNDGEIVDELITIIENSEFEYAKKIDSYMDVINNKKESIAFYKAKTARYKDAISSLEYDLKKLHCTLGRVMGNSQYESTHGKISRHLDESLDIDTTPAKTPEEYIIMVAQKPKKAINTDKIRADIEAGKELEFARIVHKKRVSL